jgi:transposase
MVLEHTREHASQWAAILSIASKIGCTPETLRQWVRQTEIDTGQRGGLTSEKQARIKELEGGGAWKLDRSPGAGHSD